ADAMNQMVHETARVLRQIKQVAYDVQDAANMVKVQGDKVSSVAASERTTIEHTRQKLHDSAKTMSDVVATAKASKDVANRATESTEQALETVIRSIDGMQEIRGIISETEKRIKRLGERSQEITSVVEIINNIAERTNVLALNASMQAAAAGEAGRSFAVVADEVQRLAERTGDATRQIEALVKTIQADTSEAISSMEQSTSNVVDGATLAENAGSALEKIEKVSTNLAQRILQISDATQAHAKESVGITKSMNAIQKITVKTSKGSTEASGAIGELSVMVKSLHHSVAGFNLPNAKHYETTIIPSVDEPSAVEVASSKSH
ncbi:MAG: hypothetical protein KAU21_03415, partial [Gammaproteobacteria bacterium]|nr:hypothetical protein [Gammaproteobacteria bacterium]